MKIAGLILISLGVLLSSQTVGAQTTADSAAQSKPPVTTPPPATPPATPASDQQSDETAGKQTNHIAGILPNYRAVDAGKILPPMTVGGKLKLAGKDSLDYGSFTFAGLLAAYDMGTKAYPEFHQGVPGYGRYFWHTFADQAVANVFTEALVPIATREDPRYYTLGHGGFFRRTWYAANRLVVTKTDAGGTSFNFSEILGNGMGAGVSSLYYPGQERTAYKVTQNWMTQVAADGLANIVKEFWPDIRRKLHHGN